MSDLTDLAHSTMPFAMAVGLSNVSGDADGVTATATWAEDRCTAGGVLHGGFLMTLADSIGALAAFFHLPEDAAGTSTIESKTNFFRAVSEGEIAITATTLHAGRRTIVVQTDITRADGKLVTRTTQTQAVL